MCQDNFYLESVYEIKDEQSPKVKFLKRYQSRSDEYWCYPPKAELCQVSRECVLPVRPVIDIERKLSSRRHTVYILKNVDVINMFTQ